MKYKEKLLHLIFNGAEDDMMDWILQQPLLDQPEIFRQLNELALELEQQSGIQAQGLDGFDQKIAGYEDAILDEKLAEANFEMALDNWVKTLSENIALLDQTRADLIVRIQSNGPDIEATSEMAKRLILFEKNNGLFDSDNWKDLF